MAEGLFLFTKKYTEAKKELNTDEVLTTPTRNYEDTALREQLLARRGELELLSLSEPVAESLMNVHRRPLHARGIQCFRLESALSPEEYRNYQKIMPLLDLGNSVKRLCDPEWGTQDRERREIETGVSWNFNGNNHICHPLKTFFSTFCGGIFLGTISSIGYLFTSEAKDISNALPAYYIGAALGVAGTWTARFLYNRKNPFRELSDTIFQRTEFIRKNYPR